jgi:RNA polymerase sporulation-specific sigma factor
MTRTEELIARSQSGDLGAAEILVEENSGLIWSVAKRFLGRGTEADDLYQLGCLGFLKAVEGFDLEYGTQFSTYAVPKIAGEIRRFLRDDGAVKVSRGLKEQAAAIKAARHRLTGALGREPTIQEISRQTGFSPEEIAMAETATAATESIQRETGDEGFSLENILTDTESEEKMVEKIALRQAVERLPEREGMVIRLRYFHSLTQDRVAKVLQVSQVQVSRIEKKALAQLRELLREY